MANQKLGKISLFHSQIENGSRISMGKRLVRSLPHTVITRERDIFVAIPTEATSKAQAKFLVKTHDEFRTNVPAGKTVRPFVATTENLSADPDGWTATTPDAESLAIVRAAFIEKFNDETECNGTEGRKNPKIKLKPDGVKVLNKAYLSKAKTLLVTLYLKDHSCEWGEGPQSAHAGMTYALEHGAKPRALGSGLVLVDAGDYVNQGTSDLLFFESRGNFDGYVLFSDHFRKKAEKGWTYH